MSRPKKKEIKFSKDSILSLLQEVYNEIVEQRNTAIRIQNKMLAMMKDPEDMQTIGPVIKEQQKIINDCVEKKLSLSKLQSSIWEKSQSEKQDFTIGDLDDDLMESLINKDVEKSGETYKLGK
jgi:methionine salvage enolase-phosphatase E1